MPTIDVTSARQKLFIALGDDYLVYLKLMKNWLSKKSSKEEFETSAKHLLSFEYVHLHNQFLMAILDKCESQDNSSQMSPVKLDGSERLKVGRAKGN